MPKRLIWEGNACFTTHVVHNHTPLFNHPSRVELICSALQYAREARGLRIFGYVIMPDHIHLLTGVSSPAELQDILNAFRRFTATQLLQRLKIESVQWALSQLEAGPRDRTLWRSGFVPTNATRGDIFDQKLNYIHDNPVRAGFVRQAMDWRFSSAASYYGNEDITGPPPLKIDFPWEDNVVIVAPKQ
jgi:putative transposase